MSTNDSDRRLALTKFAEHRELVAAMREKSRDRERESSRTPGSSTTGSSAGKRSSDYVSVDSHSTSFSSRRPSTSHKRTSPFKSTMGPPPEADPSHHAKSTQTPSSSLKPPSTAKSSRRPHTSAGPRDKSNLPYTLPEPAPPPQHNPNKRNSNGQTRSGGSVRPNTGMSINEVQIPRSSLSSNHSHKRHSRGAGPIDLGGASTGAVVGMSKDGAIRAWEEEMERMESVTKRTTSDMLSFFGFGLSKRRRKEKEEKRRLPKGIFAGHWWVAARSGPSEHC